MDLSSYVQDFERCGHAVLKGLVAPATLKMLSNPRVAVQAALTDFFPDEAEREAMLCKSNGIARISELTQRWRSLAGAHA